MLVLKSSYRSAALAFLSGACILILEVAAGRLVAPIIGVSLYSWTSVVGVVLGGMTLGQYLGGRVADRAPRPQTLGILLFLGGLASFGILPLLALAYEHGDWLLEQPAIPRIFGLSAVLFFLPSVIIGAVAPVIVKLAITRLEVAGSSVGRLYALSNLGSILGVFLSGFVLISTIGSLWVVVGVGATLIVLAIVAGDLLRAPRLLGMLFVPLVGMVLLVRATNAMDNVCNQETEYYCIRYYDDGSLARGHRIRVLALDHLDHSFNALDDPKFLYYGYIKVYAEITDYLAQTRPDHRSLFIGGGGYTLPRYLELEYPRATVEVVEIDPAVTEVAHAYLGLPRDTRVKTYGADAREIVRGLAEAGERYDIIFGDAFHDIAVPYHLTTLEFHAQLRRLLGDQGIYVINTVDRFPDGLFLPSMMRTLQAVFPHVYLISDDELPETSEEGTTYVLAASGTPIDRDRLGRVRGHGPNGAPVAHVMADAEVSAWLRTAGGVLLTDDYVPTDNLLAPVFAQR